MLKTFEALSASEIKEDRGPIPGDQTELRDNLAVYRGNIYS